MRRLMISTALAGVLAGTLAFAGGAMAQDDHRDQGHAGGGAGRPAPAAKPAPAAHAAPAGGGLRPREDARQQSAPAPGAAMRGPGAAMRGPGPGMAMHGPAPSGHNFAAYNRNVTAAHHFRAPAYRRPQGWYAHRWSYGETLPALFWAQDFWINDFTDYGLMPPPPGTVWVRDGDDAILVDQTDGEIIQVNYGVFY